MFGAGVGGELLFEFCHLRPHDVLAVFEHGVDAGLDGGFEFAVLRFEVDELHEGLR